MSKKNKRKIATPADFKFDLGTIVKDKVTNFEGVVVSRSQWIGNCNTYGVKSRELKDGAPISTFHFDEPLLDVVAEGVFEPSRETGGPERSVPQTNR